MNRYHRWLEGQLPGLVERGIIGAGEVERIRSHYELGGRGNGRRTGLIVCGVLGALLVGLGLILLLAHNWYDLSRPVRTALAFSPLILAQVLTGWVIWKRRDSIAWREGASTFLMLMIALSIALVHQTYQMPSDIKQFYLVWMLLSLPLVYLLRATLPAVLYLIGITAWAFAGPLGNSDLLYFWLLAAGIGPYLVHMARKEPNSNHTAVLSWASALWFIAGVTYSTARLFEKPDSFGSGMATSLVLVVLFAVMYLAGALWAGKEPQGRHWAFVGLGAAGIIITVFIYTFFSTQNLFSARVFRFFQWRRGGDPDLAIHCFLSYGLPALAAGLLLVHLRRGRASHLLFGLSPLFITAAHVLGGRNRMLPMVVFNLYFLALGVGALASGLRSDRLSLVNLGLVLLAALILARFFDSDLGFVIRAVAFILVGLGFLLANILILRRRKEGTIA